MFEFVIIMLAIAFGASFLSVIRKRRIKRSIYYVG
jgi:hypothetical protein